MKKITFLVAALCATTLAFASTATITPAAMGVQGASATDATKPTTPYSKITYSVGDVTLSIDSGFCNGTQIRAYVNAKVVFTSENNISKIEITTAENDEGKDKYTASALSGSGYTAATAATSGVWTGTAKSVTLNASAQCRMLKVVVTTDGEGEDAGKIDTLTVTIAEALTVTNALADGAVAPNYYILSGTVSDLDLSTTYGNASFTLTDETGEFYVYRAYNLNNEKFTATSQLANGDEVKVLGQLKKYVKSGTTTPELVNGYLVERNGGSGDGDEDGDATELTVNYAEITYYEELSEEGAHNFSIDFMYYNATEDSVHAPYVSFDIYSASATAVAGSYSIANGTIGEEYSYAMLTDAELVDDDADGVAMTAATLTLAYVAANETYKAVAAFTASDGKKYTINAEVPVSVFKALDTDGDYYYDDYEDYTLDENTTAIRNIEVLNDVYAREGRIYAEEGAQIYTIMGLNVTEQNKKSTLGEGIYIVKAGNKLAKIVVK